MASTPNQGFPYPVGSDIPDVPADIQALAESLDTKITADDATIASLDARLTALENGTGGIGWIPIATGSNSGASFSIDLTAGGLFPDPPLFNLIRLHMRYDLDASDGQVRMQINGDSDAVYRSGMVVLDAEGNIDTSVVDHESAGSSWVIGHGSTVSTGNLICTIFHTAANPGLLNFQSTSTRESDTASVQRFAPAWGDLTSTKTLSSLTLLVGGAATSYSSAWWWVEGLRMEHPS
ncbi:hypothetical protein GCM10027447_12360 [Glycomyces halotolerans]